MNRASKERKKMVICTFVSVNKIIEITLSLLRFTQTTIVLDGELNSIQVL